MFTLYSSQWSMLSSNKTANFPDLSTGSHIFYLHSLDGRDGDVYADHCVCAECLAPYQRGLPQQGSDSEQKGELNRV